MILAGLALAACSTQMLKEMAREMRQFENRYANNTKEPPPSPAVYCYSTLGVVNCYSKPKPENEDSQYVGSTAQPQAPTNPDSQIGGTTDLAPPAKAEDIVPDLKLDPDAPANPAPTMATEESAPPAAPADAPANKPFRPDFVMPEQPPSASSVFLRNAPEKPADPPLDPIVPPKALLPAGQ